jgi:hypothetical protein
MEPCTLPACLPSTHGCCRLLQAMWMALSDWYPHPSYITYEAACVWFLVWMRSDPYSFLVWMKTYPHLPPEEQCIDVKGISYIW